MAALAALYPAKLQKVAAFDRFGHYRLETGEQASDKHVYASGCVSQHGVPRWVSGSTWYLCCG